MRLHDMALGHLRHTQEARLVLKACRRALITIGLFSGLLNLLALTGSIYMLQVYDRVVPTRNFNTLAGLTGMVICVYAFQGYLDCTRQRLLIRIGAHIDKLLRERVMRIALTLPLRGKGGDAMQPVKDLDQVRNFLSGLGPAALFDLPWLPVYLILIFCLHPYLGLFAIAASLLLAALTLLTEIVIKPLNEQASRSTNQRQVLGEAMKRNAETIRALGMTERMVSLWSGMTTQQIEANGKLVDHAAALSTTTKMIRMALQSLILGLGAYLVINDKATGGIIIAASITLGRALAPIESVIAHWKGLVATRLAYHRLSTVFEAIAAEPERMALPAPSQQLELDAVSIVPPGGQKAVVHQISFTLTPGTVLGIIGPSAAGKSTLARGIVGAWLAQSGEIRLDHAALAQWDPDELGQYIGYLPQNIDLIDANIGTNIARFDAKAKAADVLAAAQAAGVDEMIRSMPNGYSTMLGEAGIALSGGQRQRIGLARALYKSPFLTVLDEPNSNLDADGDSALANALLHIRQRKAIAIVISHRPAVLHATTHIMVMRDGRIAEFGDSQEIMRKLMTPVSVAATPAQTTPAQPSGRDGAQTQTHPAPNTNTVSDAAAAV